MKILTSQPHLALLALAPFFAPSQAQDARTNAGLNVTTDIFTVQGTVWPNNSLVHFYGNIPYAQPPEGIHRFKPPANKTPVPGVINGTWFGPSCLQFDDGKPNVYKEFLPGFLLAPQQRQSEDCLTLNVWTPSNATAGAGLPVLIWIHGGEWETGGAATPYTYGDRLARDQNAVVVSINYRLNIFGFPGASGLHGQNLNPGLLDQRKAVEFIQAHIHAFGGDAAKMILVGTAAGGSSVDMYSYAYPDDPIVRGFIALSGIALSGKVPTGQNFSYVAKQLGCDSDATHTYTADEELECMQKLRANDILTVLTASNVSLPAPNALAFLPAADNQTRFTNYTDLQARGRFARVPSIYSSNVLEGSALVPYANASAISDYRAADVLSLRDYVCPGDVAAAAKRPLVGAVWRVQYNGVWKNLNPLPWLGVYHSADVPVIFGTSDLLGPDEADEVAATKYIQLAIARFANAPYTALYTYKGGWPVYDNKTKSYVNYGYRDREGFAALGEYDAFAESCRLIGAPTVG